MEIQIDTSALYESNKLINKIEEITLKEIKEFTNNSIKSNMTEFMNVKENYLIKMEYFLIEKFGHLCTVLYGEIIENNQTEFEYKKSDNVFVYIKNPRVIKEILDKNKSEVRIEIEECSIIHYPKIRNDDKNLILYIMTHISSIIKIFFSLKNFKFNRWDNILISSKYFQEAYLLKKILNLIGYSVGVIFPNSNDNKTCENIFKDELITNSLFEQIDIIGDDCEINIETKFYNIVIETSLEFFENKIKFLKYLKNQGNLILMTLDQEINPELDPSKFQLDPRDLELMIKNSLGMSVCNLNTLLKFNNSKGREMNFINQLLDKILTSEGINDGIKETDLKSFIKNLRISSLTVTNLLNATENILTSSNSISILIINDYNSNI